MDGMQGRLMQPLAPVDASPGAAAEQPPTSQGVLGRGSALQAIT